MTTKTVIWEDDDGLEHETRLPATWEICSHCGGDGKHSRRLGAFTSSEWADEDPEWQEEYLAGRYDEQCEACDGAGKVLEIDESRLSDEQRAAVEYLDNCARYEREDRMTRRAESGGDY